MAGNTNRGWIKADDPRIDNLWHLHLGDMAPRKPKMLDFAKLDLPPLKSKLRPIKVPKLLK